MAEFRGLFILRHGQIGWDLLNNTEGSMIRG